MDLQEMTMILGQAKLLFPNVNFTPETFKVWHAFFIKTPTKAFQLAMIAAVKTPGKAFFPTPGEVNEKLMELTKNRYCPDELWDRCLGVAASGMDEKVLERLQNDAPQAVEAARLIGWDRIRYTDISELQYVRRDFLATVESTQRYFEKESLKADAIGVLTRLAIDGPTQNQKLI